MKLWFVEPYDDELLSSWLIRTAIAQGCQPLTLTHKIWGKSWRPWTSDLDLNIDSEYLQILLSNNMSQEQLLLLKMVLWNWVIITLLVGHLIIESVDLCYVRLLEDLKKIILNFLLNYM